LIFTILLVIIEGEKVRIMGTITPSTSLEIAGFGSDLLKYVFPSFEQVDLKNAEMEYALLTGSPETFGVRNVKEIGTEAKKLKGHLSLFPIINIIAQTILLAQTYLSLFEYFKEKTCTNLSFEIPYWNFIAIIATLNQNIKATAEAWSRVFQNDSDEEKALNITKLSNALFSSLYTLIKFGALASLYELSPVAKTAFSTVFYVFTIVEFFQKKEDTEIDYDKLSHETPKIPNMKI
jgi:hypothetical protein